MIVYDKLKKFFFPRNLTCSVCKRENFNGESICDECESVLPYNDKAVCGHCGRKVAYSTDYCDFCKNHNVELDGARSVFEYKDPINKLIRRLKYYGERYLAEEFAQKMAKVYFRSLPTVDVAVSVPADIKRLKQRGYNQSELIARAFCKFTQTEYIANALTKTRETKSQVGLTLKERKENLTGSFAVTDKKQIKDKVVLIVDDVLTTGTTLGVISEKLKKSGAKEVYALTVASVTFGEKFTNASTNGEEKE